MIKRKLNLIAAVREAQQDTSDRTTLAEALRRWKEKKQDKTPSFLKQEGITVVNRKNYLTQEDWDYTHGILDGTRKLSSEALAITSRINEDDNPFLTINLDNLDYQVGQSPTQIYVIGRMVARMVRLEYLLKREIKKIEGKAKLKYCTHPRPDGIEKPITDAQITSYVDTDEEVNAAHSAMAEVLEAKRALEELLEAVKRKCDFTPSLQRRLNDLHEFEGKWSR